MADLVPTFITGAEARAIADQVNAYFGAVDVEVAASRLDAASVASWGNARGAFALWYRDVQSRGAVSTWLSSKSIADTADEWRTIARDFSARARAAGAPATAPNPPEVPGSSSSSTPALVRWVGWGIAGILAIEVVRLVRR